MLLLASASAHAWTMKINDGNLKYECTPGSSDIVCSVNGSTAGRIEKNVTGITYRDRSNRSVGSAEFSNGTWRFRDAAGKVIGTAEFSSGETIYKDSKGTTVGRASAFGSYTRYLNGSGATVGETNTSDMPIRPVPLELWLRDSRNTAAPACLSYLYCVNLEKPAGRGGMKTGDILLGYEGSDWSVFDINEKSCKKVNEDLRAKDESLRNSFAFVYIVYRPAEGEKGEVKGTIYKMKPMPSGLKGFKYYTDTRGPSFITANSKAYYEGIRALYPKGGFENVSVDIPDIDDYSRDSRIVPGAHQEFRELYRNNKTETGWFWISDKDGMILSESAVKSLLQNADK